MKLLNLTGDRRRWMALVVVCMAQLMIVLDTTIVNVALPAIQRDLHFTQGNLTWVINAFLVTFGSFLLLAGRLGDLIGRRRVFLTGVGIFTAASMLCGIAPSQGVLIAARFAQGVGAAMQASVILAIIVTEFPEPGDRARAMSAYVFTAVAGGSLGLLAGGVLTQALSWHWIFFVNLPIGIVTIVAGRALIPRDTGIGLGHGVDWVGSVLVTLSLMTLVYAIVQATNDGWGSSTVLGFGTLAAVLMAVFLAVESRIENPIMPLRMLRLRGLIGSSVVRAFLVTGMYSTFFLGTLYLEHVRHFSALQTGLAFLPWTMTVGALSLGITARIVARFGPMRVLITGMATVMGGLALMTTTSTTTAFFPTMFFAFFMIGLGIGSAFMPLLTIAMADVPAPDAGLGSGIVNLSQQVGGALGIAVLGTIATTRSKALEAQHHTLGSALVGGYHLAFLIGVLSVGAAILTTLAVLRTRPQVAEAEPIVAEQSEIGHAAESGRRRVAIALSSSGARRPQPESSATAAAAGRRGPGRDWRSRRPRRPAPDRGRAE
ncbi:MAG TPA: MFS transporter [Solirubrobacteraceae bacterium]|nr:MFS transporter [Solirubrobacteraceae bacterium]